MRIGIVGTRTFTNYACLEQVLRNISITSIVTGDATGTDALARRYAYQYNIPLTVHSAEWHKHGKAAGPIRNKLIVDDSYIIIAFWDYMSRGTKSSIDLAYNMHKPVYIVDIRGIR